MQQYATKSLMHFARTVKAGLERARAPYEGLWRDIRDNFEPTLGRELDDELNPNDATAKRGDEKILNSKPRDLVDRLAAGLQSGITNQARQWFRLIDKRENGRPEGNSQSERKAIDAATETLQTTIASSNVYSSLIAMYMRLGQFGTSCALLLPDEFATIRLDVIDEGAYWIGQDRRGRICTLLRRCKWTTRQLVDEFGREAIPPEYVNDFDSGRGETVRRVWHLVLPTSEVPKTERRRFAGHPFASIYWLDADVKSSVLRIGGFDYNPIIAAINTAKLGYVNVTSHYYLSADNCEIINADMITERQLSRTIKDNMPSDQYIFSISFQTKLSKFFFIQKITHYAIPLS